MAERAQEKPISHQRRENHAGHHHQNDVNSSKPFPLHVKTLHLALFQTDLLSLPQVLFDTNTHGNDLNLTLESFHSHFEHSN